MLDELNTALNASWFGIWVGVKALGLVMVYLLAGVGISYVIRWAFAALVAFPRFVRLAFYRIWFG